MNSKIKVGVIGLGEVAQTIHLPVLQQLQEQFEVVAICDVSPTLVETIGNHYQVPHRYEKVEDLVENANLEAIFVLNSDEYHADCIVQAVRRGLHVFVEKPMCLTISDAERIIEEKNKAQVNVMVGYMRRYSPAYQQAVKEIQSLDKINFARFKDIIGPNSFFIGQTNHVHRFQDVADHLVADRAMRGQVQVGEALGSLAEKYYHTYRQLGGLASHGLSAMRGMLGMPDKVIAAARWRNDQHFMNAVFQYGDYMVHYETGVDNQGRFDAAIEVHGDLKTVEVQYDTAYIRHLPTTLTIKETIGDSYQETFIRPTYTDAYTVELTTFYDTIRHNKAVPTPPEDAIDDLRLFKMLIEAMEQGSL
ncbi:Gfo/Idh/MocA family protein [Paenibacillus yanchengensis]|uniref:Gfo/Idh/MocA family protein n=1 Tax=Paenibacillus yanchengensis TaxID=2035833 RepID=A0ABW4YHK2_9BACL